MNFLVLFFICLLILSEIGYSYSIDLSSVGERSNRINEDYEGKLLCMPDQSGCSNPQFIHNSTAIDTTTTKYTVESNSNSFILSIHNVVPSDAGQYQCRHSCNGQNINSNTVTLEFIPPVVFLVPNNVTYHQYIGSNITFYCAALYYTALQWQDINNHSLPQSEKYQLQQSGNVLNLTVVNVTTADVTSFSCAANNLIVVRAAVTAVLKVYMKPTTTAVSNESITVFEGNTTSFTCTATGIPRPHIIWSNDNDLAIGGRIQKTQYIVNQYTISSTLTISGIQTSDEGKYKCAGGNDNGTSTLIFTLTVQTPPTPGIYINLENINSSSVIVIWSITGVTQESSVTITWIISDISNGTINKVVKAQDSSPIVVTSLQPNTSYTFNVTILSLSSSSKIKTFPEELSYSLLLTNDISSTSLIPVVSSSEIIVQQTSSAFLSSSASSLILMISSEMLSASLSSSLILTTPPVVVEISKSNHHINIGIGVSISICLIIILTSLIILSIRVCFVKRKKSKRTLNVQSIDKQSSIRSDCNLLGDSKGYPTRISGISLNSIHNNNGPLSPHTGDFQEMTFNPQFTGHTLSQDSVSVYNTCSSCPPVPGKVHENLYHIETYGCEEFEMTDNPYYDYEDIPTAARSHKHSVGSIDPYSTAKWTSSNNDFESASQVNKSPKESNVFEFNDNSNYEPCPNFISPQHQQHQLYSSNMSLSRTQSPRFQIVSEKRGDVREKVNLVNQI